MPPAVTSTFNRIPARNYQLYASGLGPQTAPHLILSAPHTVVIALMYEYCKPGQKVLRSGIYRVTHDPDCAAEHRVICVAGEYFPRCHGCGDDANFSLFRYAPDVGSHELFRLGGAANDKKPGHHKQVWTTGDLTELRRMFTEDRTATEMSAELGRSEGAVLKRASNEGLLERSQSAS